MDNLAYLEQISAKPPKPSLLGGEGLFSKKVIIGLVAAVVLALLIIIIGSLSGSGLSKAAESTFRLNERTNNLIKTLDTYNKSLKSSELRGMGTSLKSVLQTTVKPLDNSLDEDFADLKDSLTEPVAIEENNSNAALTDTLENARLNATLDRVFPREMTYQIYLLRDLEQTCLENTDNDALKSALESSLENLNNLYSQFSDFML